MSNLPTMKSGGSVAAIVPETFDEVYRLASAAVAAKMTPNSIDTPEKATIAIMQGLEVGMTPMVALQSIAVINGTPSIWGDGALGLIRGSGLCESIREWKEGTGDQLTAYCEVKRKGEAEPVTRSFSMDEAKAAQLLGKKGPWQQYPTRMLQMRARSWALRDGFADVLKGLAIAEEAQDYDRRAVPEPQTSSFQQRLEARKTQQIKTTNEGFTAAQEVIEAELIPQDETQAEYTANAKQQIEEGEISQAAHEVAQHTEQQTQTSQGHSQKQGQEAASALSAGAKFIWQQLDPEHRKSLGEDEKSILKDIMEGLAKVGNESAAKTAFKTHESSIRAFGDPAYSKLCKQALDVRIGQLKGGK
ncbi:recombinase RecT [Polycladidibacter hongkongensis]|uniref:recombinase RecT n=1 Tax=Polycladidibacter hongkongensis TaxID=1647556 RepID=UPI00082B495C|nr:recombinase RecT [Pseudovibrio hongkongensis]